MFYPLINIGFMIVKKLEKVLYWWWVSILLIPIIVKAEEPTTNLGLDAFRNYTNLGTNINLIESIANIVDILLGFLGVIAVLLVLWGGFKWMTAAGDEQQITEAKKLLGGGVIGLIIILAAYAISSFVVSNLINATGYAD